MIVSTVRHCKRSQMELRIGEYSRSIPESWIGRWHFLTDYREEIESDVVQWNYTDVAAVDKWIALNENMDDVETRRSKKKFPPNDNKNILRYALSKEWPFDRKWAVLSEVYNVIEFMNPVSDSYLLYVIIDVALTEQRRREAYERLGRYVVASNTYPHRLNNVTVVKLLGSSYYNGSIEPIPDDFPVSPSVLREVYAVLGVIRNSYQKFLQNDSHLIGIRPYTASDLASLDWEEMYRMRPIPNAQEVRGMMNSHNRHPWYIRLLALDKLPIFMFMAGNALPSISTEYPLRSNNTRYYEEEYQGTPTDWLALDDVRYTQKLIEKIDYYVDTVASDSLVPLARSILGLGPLLDNTGTYVEGTRSRSKIIHSNPLFFISTYNSLYMPSPSGGASEDDYITVCLYLGNRWGSFWLQSCIKCLLRILEHREKIKKLDWSDLITTHKKQKSVDIVSKKENKKLLAFCEAAMIAVDEIEKKAGGATIFSGIPAMDMYV